MVTRKLSILEALRGKQIPMYIPTLGVKEKFDKNGKNAAMYSA